MAKIAVVPDPPQRPRSRTLARGDGWSVSEVICTLGPQHRPFEERHSWVSISLVTAGTFHYRSHGGGDLMTPGSLMLGGAGQCFECSHEHGTGDRCLSFSYSPAYFDLLEAVPSFRALRVPPIRALAPLTARATAALAMAGDASWEEIGMTLAARTVALDRGSSQPPSAAGPGAAAAVARLVRTIQHDAAAPHDLRALARAARLSPYHFLRVFQAVTGVTPHQYILRLRLQQAAVRLRAESAKIVDVAFDCGFGDLSNFNRMFRAEFGVSPRIWRRSVRT